MTCIIILVMALNSSQTDSIASHLCKASSEHMFTEEFSIRDIRKKICCNSISSYALLSKITQAVRGSSPKYSLADVCVGCV